MRCVPIIPFGAFRLPRVVGLADDELGPRPVAGIGPVIGRMRLPTEPIGTTTVTFSGVQAGTEIHVYLLDGTEVAGVESCGPNHVLAWSVYAAGSPNNTVYITLIKRGLQWRRFNYQSQLGAQSIPIFQQSDLGYNNPA